MRRVGCLIILFLMSFANGSYTQDFRIEGIVSNTDGVAISGARIQVIRGVEAGDTTVVFSNAEGFYSLNVGREYDSPINNTVLFQNFPNPFSDYTQIPYMMPATGRVLISVYDIQGRFINLLKDQEDPEGLNFASWDGRDMQNRPMKVGVYLIVLQLNSLIESVSTFYDPQGWSGQQIPALGFQKPSVSNNTEQLAVKKIVVSASNHSPKILENLTLNSGINVIDFELYQMSQNPFLVDKDYFYAEQNGVMEKFLVKGINIGVGEPGFTPGNLMQITEDDYTYWFTTMADVGFNSLRVYSLQGPQFYKAFAEFNLSHPESPLYLFHGVWLEEISTIDLYDHTEEFQSRIREVVDCVHGNRFGAESIPSRSGLAYGEYTIDVSQWVMGYLVGREVAPFEVLMTNNNYPDETSYNGLFLSLQDAEPSEVWVTWQMEYCINYELRNYQCVRPVGFSNWPTLDPMTHPTNLEPDEDLAKIGLNEIDDSGTPAGVFVAYHAYPYFPDFISTDPNYQQYTDNYGSNSYLGYLHDLKAHYPDKAVLIAEYGVPSSYGNARKTSNGMDQGGHTEAEQGEYTIRMLHNIFDAQCAGGIAFAQIDEWFKVSWITSKIETYTYINSVGHPFVSRSLWHNLTNPEQNFGLLSYDPVAQDLQSISLTNNALQLASVKTLADVQYFTMEINFNSVLQSGETFYVALDTYDKELGESVLPDGTQVNNRSEFVVEMKMNESANLLVTEAYNLSGNTSKYIFQNSEQVYHSIRSDGKAWVQQEWIIDANKTYFNIGSLHARIAGEPKASTDAVIFDGSKVTIQIPWTMLYFTDPTRLAVVHFEGQEAFRISDGIALTISKNGIISETERSQWASWTEAPLTQIRKKDSYFIVREGLRNW